MLIPESFKSIQVLILDLLRVFRLRDLDPFLVLQLITDVVTINHPNMVDDLLPSRPNYGGCAIYSSIGFSYSR